MPKYSSPIGQMPKNSPPIGQKHNALLPLARLAGGNADGPHCQPPAANLGPAAVGLFGPLHKWVQDCFYLQYIVGKFIIPHFDIFLFVSEFEYSI